MSVPFGLYPEEYRTLKALSSPALVQDYLDGLAINYEKRRETCLSPRGVLRSQKAHCMEGAMLAAAAFLIKGRKPLLLDLKSEPGDDDHVVALYQENGYWGAVSKTNHAVLRFRDPVYRTVRELALSYYHEYFLNSTGRKTLRSYSAPFSLSRFGTGWITEERDLWEIPKALDRSRHLPIAPSSNLRKARNAHALERAAGRLKEWKREDSGT